MTVRTRFAPSPTGYLHIGGLRTALFSWLYARRHAGCYVLRIEDTDLERSTPQAIEQILDGLEWAGLDQDEGPFFQTKRFDRYQEILQEMLAAGRAYRCYCTRAELEQMRAEQTARSEKPRYDGRCRIRSDQPADMAFVVRFKNPLEGEVVVDDVVHGRVVFQNAELDDLIIARSDGTPTYNFCVVVDDMDMRITHVIRGDDHLNNTPRQMNMLKALGHVPPVYAHLPMILGQDGAKLSKRHGAVSVLQYRDEGFLPEAVLNYLARLGWSYGDQEIFSIEELVSLFDIAAVNKSASAFDAAKLSWLNQQHMMRAAPARVASVLRWHLEQEGVQVSDEVRLEQIVVALRERTKTVREMAKSSLFFFRAPDTYDEKAVRKNITADVPALLAEAIGALEEVGEWTAPAIHEAISALSQRKGIPLGKLAQPMRIAVCGGTVSPPIDATLVILGKSEALARLARAQALWGAQV